MQRLPHQIKKAVLPHLLMICFQAGWINPQELGQLRGRELAQKLGAVGQVIVGQDLWGWEKQRRGRVCTNIEQVDTAKDERGASGEVFR